MRSCGGCSATWFRGGGKNILCAPGMDMDVDIDADSDARGRAWCC